MTVQAAPTITEAAKKERIAALDILRGGAMVLVMLYHLLFDLRYIYNIPIPRPITPGQPETETVHTCFLWVLFAVSGICTRYSKDPIKRGAFLYIAGWLITFVTSYFIPSELIVFGVLSCFGACMVICGLLRPSLDGNIAVPDIDAHSDAAAPCGNGLPQKSFIRNGGSAQNHAADAGVQISLDGFHGSDPAADLCKEGSLRHNAGNHLQIGGSAVFCPFQIHQMQAGSALGLEGLSDP